jgi:hypothetical protein
MARDVKEVIGVLMRVLDGEEITQADVEDLGFEGDGDVQAALNAAYIKLLEFVHDRNARQRDRALDLRIRESLQTCLDEITIACDRQELLRS